MNTNWTPLFSDMLGSSLWRLGRPGLPEAERKVGKDAKLLFLTMIQLADQEGFLRYSEGALADEARLTDDETRAALKVLESEDKDSRTPDYKGRRVERKDGGWIILNYKLNWERMQVEKRKALMRMSQAKLRMKKKSIIPEPDNNQDLARQHEANAAMHTKHAARIRNGEE